MVIKNGMFSIHSVLAKYFLCAGLVLEIKYEVTIKSDFRNLTLRGDRTDKYNRRLQVLQSEMKQSTGAWLDTRPSSKATKTGKASSKFYFKINFSNESFSYP